MSSIYLHRSVLLILVAFKLSSSSAFAPTNRNRQVRTALRSSTDEDVKQLLEKARQLREEAAAMSGQTVQEMQQESMDKKRLSQEQQAVIDKAREERDAKSRTSLQILPVPENSEAQIIQAAAAIERAFKDGITKQTVRFALLAVDEEMSGEQNEWPGGAQQMFRESGRPLTEGLLREVRAYPAKQNSVEKLPPVIETKDIWDFDGSAICTATHGEETNGVVKALIFPNTDSKYLNDIEAISRDVGPENLFLLVNPFWRSVESWSFNILQPNGKRRAQEVVFDEGFDVTYAVVRFSARGEDCVALYSYPNEWQIYAYREDPSWFNQERPIWLGSSKTEPTSSQVTELLNSRPEFRMSKNMRQLQRQLGNDDQ